VAFHVQLRQFPHVARAFNLTRDELQSWLVEPWLAGRAVQLQDRSWDPERARLTICEAPELRPDEIGLGRGWANVTRAGTEVTETLLADARGSIARSTGELKSAILARCARGPVALRDIVPLAGTEQLRASERLALAEQAAWELMHSGEVRLVQAGHAPSRERWRELLFSWATWLDPAAALEASGSGPQATTSAISRARSESEANR
jgi:hypothetical protein